MTRLDGISADDLREALEAVDGKRPAVRLVAAMAYDGGATQTEIASWLGVERKTVYNWLVRLEERPGALADAARDADRPGRPRKLSDAQRDRLASDLRNRPVEASYDRRAWTPTLVRRHVRDRFGIEYSLPTCRRLLDELGTGEASQ